MREQAGLEGELLITRAFTHIPDLHYTDRFAEVEMCFAVVREKEQCEIHRLHPYVKEAEHVSQATEASRRTYGIQPASAEFAETALTVMRLKNGGVLQYTPINLAGIAAIRLRYKSLKDATLSLFLEPYDELAKLDLSIDESTLLPELPQASVLDRLKASGKGHVIERLERSVYQNWREITVPVHRIQDLAGPRTLSIKVEGNDRDVLMELDTITFIAEENL